MMMAAAAPAGAPGGGGRGGWGGCGSSSGLPRWLWLGIAATVIALQALILAKDRAILERECGSIQQHLPPGGGSGGADRDGVVFEQQGHEGDWRDASIRAAGSILPGHVSAWAASHGVRDATAPAAGGDGEQADGVAVSAAAGGAHDDGQAAGEEPAKQVRARGHTHPP